MTQSIAFINQKGGVGKTTLVANAGAWWGREGHRVLLIDLDPQGHLTLHFHGGIDEEKREENNIYRVLRGECSFADSIQTIPAESIDLVPSHIDLSAAEWELGQEVGREVILRDKLQAFLADRAYDVVLIDCPPSLGLLSLNALAGVDEVVVPVQAEFFALLGMAQLMRVIDLVRSRLHPKLEWRVVVPTLVDLRTNLGRDVIGELEGHVPGMVTEHWLTKRVKVAEAPSHGMSIFTYAGDTPAAEEFRLVCGEIARRIELAPPSGVPFDERTASSDDAEPEPTDGSVEVPTEPGDPVSTDAESREAESPEAEPTAAEPAGNDPIEDRLHSADPAPSNAKPDASAPPSRIVAAVPPATSSEPVTPERSPPASPANAPAEGRIPATAHPPLAHPPTPRLPGEGPPSAADESQSPEGDSPRSVSP